MKTMNKKRMDVYPWAVPTLEQMRMFDTLSFEAQLKMVQDAITEGLESGISDKSMNGITEEARSELTAK